MFSNSAVNAAYAGLLGLLIGGFLNVVIYRTPAMMYRDWLAESIGNLMPSPDAPTLWSLVFGGKTHTPAELETAADKAARQIESLPVLNLSQPRSRCGSCGHTIAWYQNIPVLSYAWLRGKCSACKAHISIRYPLVELIVAALFAVAGYRFGLSLSTAFWAAFVALLVCQFLIDLDTQLLPDSLNYALLWLGLTGAALGLTGVPLSSAVWGVVAGYLSLWSVFHAYRIVTGKEGMGYGDFKLLAALGAWFGADYVFALILMSSLVGAILGLTLLLVGKLAHKNIPISFGPFLAGAGLVCFVVGPEEVRHLVPFVFPFATH